MISRRIEGVETSQILKEETHRFLDMVLKDEFWAWVELYYFLDIDTIIEDLAEFQDLNASEKIISIIIEFAEIMDVNGVTDNKSFKDAENKIREEFGYKDIYVMRTMIKILLKYFTME